MNRRHLATLLLLPALTLTACGGDPEPAASAPPPTADIPSAAPSGTGDGGSSTDGPGALPSSIPTEIPTEIPSQIPSELVNAFATCMREEGIEVPDDVSNWQPDPQDPRAQRAFIACISRSGAPNS